MPSPLTHPVAATGTTGPLARLLRLIDEEMDAAVRLRHALHRAPELSHDERETSRTVSAMLPVEPQTVIETGLLARIGRGAGSPIVVRAELDALPMTERTAATFRSRNGAMHACGHDVHIAALVALCRAAARIEAELPRPLVALFQPSEEAYPSGAEQLVQTRTLDGIGAAVAAHLHPEIAWGEVAFDPGAVNASSDTVEIVITGAPAHGAYPHRGRDPLLALADTVSTLHASVGRRVDPLAGAVLTVGMMSAGEAENMIPGTARARLTLRALDPMARETLQELVRDVVSGVAAAHGCTAQIDVTRGAPSLVNDEDLVRATSGHLAACGFSLAATWRSCGADDFAFLGEVTTRLGMAFVGIDGAPGFDSRPLHHPEFLPPDEAIAKVARAHAALYFGAIDSCPGSDAENDAIPSAEGTTASLHDPLACPSAGG